MFVGFSKDERRQAFSSRMDVPFDVGDFVARYSERRIRIADMVGRRGRFMMLGMAGFFYLYTQVAAEPSPNFATLFLQDNLFDAVITGWIFLAFYYANGWVAASFYGPQSRVMDGVLARANCLLITTLWAAFKFVMVPIGTQLARLFRPGDFAVVFALIWGSYLVTDALSEIGGSLFGKQPLRVWGIGDVNRKSIGGTVSGLRRRARVLPVDRPRARLPHAWLGARGGTGGIEHAAGAVLAAGHRRLLHGHGNALICWAFGAWVV